MSLGALFYVESFKLVSKSAHKAPFWPYVCRSTTGYLTTWKFHMSPLKLFLMKYGLKILLIHSFFERWKLEINEYNDRLQKFKTCRMLNIWIKICLIMRFYRLKFEPWNISERWNMGPRLSIFENSSTILLITYPSDHTQQTINAVNVHMIQLDTKLIVCFFPIVVEPSTNCMVAMAIILSYIFWRI